MKKFKENLNLAVFTTQYVINKASEISRVYHYNDGAWQFSGNETNLNESEYKIVSLREIVILDSSICELADLPKGYEAARKNKEDKWVISISAE